MIAYLDSSVLLRVVLGQRGRLREWTSVREGIASAGDEMTVVEPARAILSRAGESLPTPLGALDAIHLATAPA